MSKAKVISLIIKNSSAGELGKKISNLAFDIESGFESDNTHWSIHATNELDRSSKQNSLLWSAYYPAIAKKMGDLTAEAAGARCKRKFGVSLMKEQAAKGTKKALVIKKELHIFGLIPDDRQTKADGWITIMPVQLWAEEAQIEAYKYMNCTRNFTMSIFCEYIKSIEIWAAQDLGLCLESINTTLRNKALNI